MENEIDKFRDLISTWNETYKLVIVSYIALRKNSASTPTLIAGYVDL
jgi:hypothetical protein